MERIAIVLTAALLVGALGAGAAFAQKGEKVIMLEEVVIRVEPELPTVMVTISRQEPEVQAGELKRPTENILLETGKTVKPNPAKAEISRIENPQKILAKTREP